MNERTLKAMQRAAREGSEYYIFYSKRSSELCRSAVRLAEKRAVQAEIDAVNIRLLSEHSDSMGHATLERAVHTRRNLMGQPSRFNSFGGVV